LQDELFGHKEGAFTSALTERQGLVDLAKGGDLFLDEVGDLDLDCQGELLMFLDSGEYRRIGDSLLRRSDCNIIAATNRQIDERIRSGHFRKDLFSRLAHCRITVPPLRERKEDIAPIMEFYIQETCGQLKPYDPEILTLFEKFDWREGNVRELISATRYMCRKAKDEPTILRSHVSPFYHAENGSLGADAVNFYNLVETQQVFQDGLDTYLSQIEKIILKKVAGTETEVPVLAQKLKISEATLGRRLRKYELPRGR
jgi:transcriptional regulator with PAS, ATPase and Fis domain